MSEDNTPTSSDELIRRAKESLQQPRGVDPPEPPVQAESNQVDERYPAERLSSQPAPHQQRSESWSGQVLRRPTSSEPAPASPDAGDSRPRSRAWAVPLAVVVAIGGFVAFLQSDPSEPPDTTTIEVAPDPAVTFRDDFDEEPAGEWVWENEIPDRWRITALGGTLRIHGPPFQAGPGEPKNVPLVPAPGDAYTIETRIEFVPSQNFQSAGLIVFEDGGNYIQLVRAFCDLDWCVEDGVYLDSITNGGAPQSPGGHQLATHPGHVFLRIDVTEDAYVGMYSYDGVEWFGAGTISREFEATRVGLVANQNVPEPPPAFFDYFELKS